MEANRHRWVQPGMQDRATLHETAVERNRRLRKVCEREREKSEGTEKGLLSSESCRGVGTGRNIEAGERERLIEC